MRDPFTFSSSETLTALLGRPLRSIPISDAAHVLRDAPVLVTGAGGSVGMPLVARLLVAGAERVVALDGHEASLFDLGRCVGFDPRVELHLADVRQESKMLRLFGQVRPEVVFHLAARKHVPFGEAEPDEPVSVNVLGTDVVARAAIAARAHHVVYPSSDKAVNPPSVYGATKRLAESLLLDFARSQTATRFHICRYVNVIGTRGSVLETFERQARAAEALTITDPEMTRYWMAMEEAIDLLWHGLALESGSRTLLDTGDPIAVATIAERLYRLVRGVQATPEWRVLGARPGERLSEELVSASEQMVPCGGGPVMRISTPHPSSGSLCPAGMIQQLQRLVAAGEPDALRAQVVELARALQ
jgi:O-antigen biosynthesis protein WbqV